MNREEILRLAADVTPKVTEWRRHLHRFPELSFQEMETSAFVEAKLKEMGYQPQTRVGGSFGVVARLEGDKPGPTIALRADMDALPIKEETDLPFASTRDGVMHACGHDAHTSVLLGAAKALARVKSELRGNVVFLFQPAEELPPGGAKGMVEAGVMEGVDAVFGLHVSNPVPTGQMGFRAGPVNAASDRFRVRLYGQGGHAAYPHGTVDPIAMLGPAIAGVQNIVSRMVNPIDSAVVTIGWVKGGEADNIIPEMVEFGGTIRTLDPKVRELVPAKIRQVVEGAAAMLGGRAEVEIKLGYPVLINDAAVTEVARRAAALVIGEENCTEPPLGMGGEDFAYFATARPGCFGRLGTGTSETSTLPAHNPKFVISEDAFPVGVAYYVALALNAADLLPSR